MKPHSLLAHAWQGLGLDVSIDEQGNGEVKMWWEAVVDTVEWKNGGRRGENGGAEVMSCYEWLKVQNDDKTSRYHRSSSKRSHFYARSRVHLTST